MNSADSQIIDRESLLKAYQMGQRCFQDLEIPDGTSLANICLDHAVFEKCWFFDCDFSNASLVGVSFVRCNLKCALFDRAILVGASFKECAVESLKARGANLREFNVVGCRAYGVDGIGNKEFIDRVTSTPL